MLVHCGFVGFFQLPSKVEYESNEDVFPAQGTESNVHGVGNEPSNTTLTVGSTLQHYGQFGDIFLGIRQSVNSFSDFLFREILEVFRGFSKDLDSHIEKEIENNY
jgi:hypothetical protein